MRICIVTPSEEFVASAGVRIRYDRLAVAARELGHEIALQPIADFQSRGDFQHDVYIFAKTYTPIACLLARRMRQSGRRVGLDIFDDYFTQTADTRLLRYRLWFNDMAEIADFFLCSTERLAAAITALIGNKPLAVIADPSEVIDQQFLDHVVERKARQIAAGEPVRITWFGIGDNPYFPVGLRDLAAFGGVGRSRVRERGDVDHGGGAAAQPHHRQGWGDFSRKHASPSASGRQPRSHRNEAHDEPGGREQRARVMLHAERADQRPQRGDGPVLGELISGHDARDNRDDTTHARARRGAGL